METRTKEDAAGPLECASFNFEGMEIHNPFMSENGINSVDPVKHYGFAEVDGALIKEAGHRKIVISPVGANEPEATTISLLIGDEVIVSNTLAEINKAEENGEVESIGLNVDYHSQDGLIVSNYDKRYGYAEGDTVDGLLIEKAVDLKHGSYALFMKMDNSSPAQYQFLIASLSELTYSEAPFDSLNDAISAYHKEMSMDFNQGDKGPVGKKGGTEKFTVAVERTYVRKGTIEIEAKSIGEARKKAFELIDSADLSTESMVYGSDRADGRKEGEVSLSYVCGEVKVHSEKGLDCTTFNVIPWLEQATDDEIGSIHRDGFCGNAAEAVARFAAQYDPDIQEIVEKEGFDARIDILPALEWVKENRPVVLNMIISGAFRGDRLFQEDETDFSGPDALRP